MHSETTTTTSTTTPTSFPAFVVLAVLLACAATACSSGSDVRRFPLQQPMWTDQDSQPFKAELEEYWSPLGWDAVDHTIFRRFARMWLFLPDQRAVNINALDEVPASSWYTNRLGHVEMTTEEIAAGPCTADDMLSGRERWTVTGGKPDGANPGFIMETEDGRRYIVKFDGTEQPERATAADVVGSRIYHAAGYHVPCNQIVFFDRENVDIAPDAEVDGPGGERPMTREDLDLILSKAYPLRDGRFRASASRFLEGKPIGPWKYQGTRDDDPNDVIDHEHRRELRGMVPLAAWVNHFDSREQNTLAMFVETDEETGAGYVRHNMLDFGDGFGSLWAWDGISRRLGHSNYLDLGDVAIDFLTLGLLARPWDDVTWGRSGAVFAYYDVEPFEADEWEPGYPNPAFDEMQEDDAAWMARKMALFDDAAVDALVAEARFDSADLADELARILRGRRDKILQRWLVDTPLSPLTAPEVRTSDIGLPELCLEDRAVMGQAVLESTRHYRARAWDNRMEPMLGPDVRVLNGGRLCMDLPPQERATEETPFYLVVDVFAWSPGITRHAPVRVHLYQVGPRFEIVGLERPHE